MYLVFGMVLGLHCVLADLCEFPNVSSVLPNIPACITPSGTIGDVADCHVTSLEGGISSGHHILKGMCGGIAGDHYYLMGMAGCTWPTPMNNLKGMAGCTWPTPMNTLKGMAGCTWPTPMNKPCWGQSCFVYAHSLSAGGEHHLKVPGHRYSACARGCVPEAGGVPSRMGDGPASGYLAHWSTGYHVLSSEYPLGVVGDAAVLTTSTLNGTYPDPMGAAADLWGMSSLDLASILMTTFVLVTLGVTRGGHLVTKYLFMMVVCTLVTEVGAVCPGCFGNIASCTYDTDGKCPTIDTMTTNANVVAGVASITATAVTLTGIISTRFLRMFTRAHLQAVLQLVRRPAPGTIFEIAKDTKISAILTAVSAGQVTMEQAAIAYAGFIDDSTDEDERALLTNKFKILTATKDLKSFATGSTTVSESGVYSWLYGKITHFVAERGMQVHVDTCESSTTSTTVLTTSIKRTKESTDFFESLNLFIMFATALGLCGSVALTEFLEFTVYDTIRMRGYDWRVAHELFVVMLRRIEDSGGKLTFVNCMAESHLSTVLDEALMSAKHYYGAAFFRQNAEGARSRNGNPDDKDKVDHCTNGKFTATAKECCPHWNMGMPHPLSAVTENGVCKRNHVCDAFVSNKGPGGKCMGNHRRDACDNPHRRSSPQQ